MDEAILLDNGNMLVPMRAERKTSRGGWAVGDAIIEIDSKHPDYEKWLPFTINEQQAREEGYID